MTFSSNKPVQVVDKVRQIGRGGGSILKTSVLRKDRLGDEPFEQRLAICRDCPGEHAVFRRDGRLWSCGKLLQVYKDQGRRKPCGCILRHKARDAKQDCPMGYWPAPDSNGVDTVAAHKKQPVVDSAQQTPIADSVALRDVAGSGIWPSESGMILRTTPNGRTRYLLDVSERRARLEARRLRLTAKQRPQPAGSAEGRDEFQKDSGCTVKTARAASAFSGELYDCFRRVVVINLDRRPDRLDHFERHLSVIDWPFRQPVRFRAVDGKRVKPPTWWRAGAGAWGCHRSHLQIIEQAMMDGLDSVLILEDDAFFEQDLRTRAESFLSSVPGDWQQIYLGGQLLFQQRQPPLRVNGQVIRPFNVNRTHAYALHRRGMQQVYAWLTNYLEHGKHPKHHLDHRLGVLHGGSDFKVYAPVQWLAGQSGGHSNIKGEVVPARRWSGRHALDPGTPFVAVIGLHRSGSSCLAGVLHKLGVHMGDKLSGYECTGGFEAVGLSHLCEKAYPFPSTDLKTSDERLAAALARHVQHVQLSAMDRGAIAGGKYPHLCAMGDQLQTVCGEGLRVIHINRPLEESIASLITRSRQSEGWLGVGDAQARQVQRWLWEKKWDFLGAVDHLTVNYADLLGSPGHEIERIITYLGLSPSEEQRRHAIEHVQPRRRRHTTSSSTDTGCKG